MRNALFVLAVLLAAPAGANPINLQTFQTEDPGAWERIQRSSQSLPLKIEELEKLAAAGIGEATLREMMRTRGVMALADADTMLRLKKAGATDDSIAALSAYAVRPNDRFSLAINADLVSPTTIGSTPYLYIEVIHSETKRQEAFFFADLRRMSRGTVRRDRSDLSLPVTVAGVSFNVPVRTRRHGKLTVLVGVSQRADLQTLVGHSAPNSRVKRHTIEYPAVSLDNRCRLNLRLTRDPSIKDLYTVQRDDLLCYWN